MNHRDVSSALVEAVIDAFTDAPIERARERWEKSSAEPWHAWLLAALVRQVRLQLWMVEIIEEHGLCRQDGAGEVPGLPGHRFYFHGRGCCFEYPSGELLDVDFWGDGGLTIDPYFFARRLWSIAAPAMVEARVRTLLPSEELCVLALKHLRDRRLLWHDASDHVFRLPRRLETLAPTSPDFTLEETRARWLHHLGDFEAPSIPALASATRLSAYHAHLMMCLATEATALAPLIGRVPEAMLTNAVESVLTGPITSRTGALVVQLDQHTLPVSSAVLKVVARLEPSEHHPYTAFAVARYLFRRKIEIESATRLLLSFARVERVRGYGGNPFLGSFAVLALEYTPRHALELLRRALRSQTPIVQYEAAAALVVLDHPWCVDELMDAVADALTWSDVSTLRAALTILTGAPDDGSDADALPRDTIDSLRPRLGPLRGTLKDLTSTEDEP